MTRLALHHVQIDETAERIALRLTRPERYNVLDIATLAELAVCLDALAPRAVPLVLHGDGGVFSLGPDVRELAAFSSDSAATYSRLGHQVVHALETWPGVTIAYLQGYAMGAGLELALGCDVLAADPQVRIGLPGLAWALLPCLGGLRRLRQRGGPLLANDLLLRGTMLDGSEAAAANLIDRLIYLPDDLKRLITAANEFSPAAIAAIRQMRLDRQGAENIEHDATLFAQPFVNGECQRRLRDLL